MASGDEESFEILSTEDGAERTPPRASLPSPALSPPQPAAPVSSQVDVGWDHNSNLNVLLSSSFERPFSNLTQSFDDISVSSGTPTTARRAGTLVSTGRSQSMSDVSSQQSKGTGIGFTQKPGTHGPQSGSKKSWFKAAQHTHSLSSESGGPATMYLEAEEEEFSLAAEFPGQQTTQGVAQGRGLQGVGYPIEPPQLSIRSRSTVPEGAPWTPQDVGRPLYTPRPERPSHYAHQKALGGQHLPTGPGAYSYVPQQVPQQQGPMDRQPPTPAPGQQYQEQYAMQTFQTGSSPKFPGCYPNAPSAQSYGSTQPYMRMGQQRQDHQHQFYQQERASTSTPQANQSVAVVSTDPVLQSPGAGGVSQDPTKSTRAAAQRLTVKVLGVDETTDLNNLEMYFENKKRSGGDTVTNAQDHRSEGFVLFTYESPEVAERVLSKSHSFGDVALTVIPYQPPATVKVSGLQANVSEALLEMYFETEKSGADSDVEKIHLDRNKGEALITFTDPEAVQRVLKRRHTIQDREVRVTLPADPTVSRPPTPAKRVAATPQFTPAPKVTPAATTATTTLTTSGSRGSGGSPRHTPTTTAQLSTSPPPADEEEATKPSSSTVEVRGVHESTSRETLRDYFENRRRSGGGPVMDVDVDSAAGVTRITFQDAKDAASVVNKNHALDTATLSVRLYHPPEMMKNAALLNNLLDVQSNEEIRNFVEARVTDFDLENIWFGDEEGTVLVIFKGNINFTQVQAALTKRAHRGHNLAVKQVPVTCSIVVSNLPRNPPIRADSLSDYFNTRRSGGQDVSAVEIRETEDWAKVTFSDCKVAATVVGRQHALGGQTLKVHLFFECLGSSGGSEEPVWKIPDPVAIEDADRDKINVLQEIPAFKEELDSRLRERHAVLDTTVMPGRLALVCCLTRHIDGARQKAKRWSGDAMAALQEYLHTLDLKEKAASTDVFSEIKPRLGELASSTAAGFHYDNNQEKLSIVWKSSLGRHVYNDIENTLHDARARVHRMQNEKTEQIRASKGKLELIKKDKVYMDVLKRFPQLIVRFEEDNGGLELRGLEEEIRPVRQVIDAALNKYTSLQFSWPADLAAALQQIPQAENVIRSTCSDQDAGGVVEITPSGFEVHSKDAEKAQAMMQAGMDAGQIRTIRLVDGADGACRLLDWQELKREVQERNKDRILITEDQSGITIAGVGSGIEGDYKLIKQFLQEHSQEEYLCKMDKPQFELFQFYLRDPDVSGSSLLTVEKSFRDDTSQMVIKGCRKDVEDAKKVIRGFQPKVIREQREFSEPSMREFLESNEWTTRQRLDIEQRLKCKILGPTAVEGAVDGVSPGCGSIQDDEDFHTSPPQPDPVDSAQVTGQPRGSMPVKPRIFLNAMSDITKEEHEVLVNSTNPQLALNQGQVSQALLEVGGQTIQEECRTNYPQGIRTGEIAVTGPGILKGKRRLMCKKLLHCCLPKTKDTGDMRTVVENAVMKCLKQSEDLGLKSVGFPALGTGTLKYPPDIVAETMYKTVVEYGRHNPRTKISDVIFILHKKPEDAAIRQAFKFEDEKHKKLLRDSLQTAEMVPRTKRNKAYKHFANTTGRVRVTILTYRQDTVEQAVQEIHKSYKDKIAHITMDVPELNDWNDNYINILERACAPVNVDVTFNFALSRISLRGLRYNVDRIPMHATLTEAQQGVHRKQNEEFMAKQVQWSTVEILLGGEKLVPYELENNYKLETGYRDGKLSVVIGHMIDNVKIGYNVNFITLEEVPEDPAQAAITTPLRVIRQDKIQEMSADLPLPRRWSGNDLDLVWLQEGSPEFSTVSESFIRSIAMPAKVTKVGQVQNATLYRQYMAKKQEMQKTMLSDRLCERDQLWHGTNQTAVDGIIKYGFNRSYCREVSGDGGDVAENALGQGVYFASEATYSSRDQYAKVNSSGERNMFRCKVLVGEYTAGVQGIRFPPDMPFTNPRRRYDSVVDDPLKPSIFVVFSDVQAYPEYLIVFKDS